MFHKIIDEGNLLTDNLNPLTSDTYVNIIHTYANPELVCLSI